MKPNKIVKLIGGGVVIAILLYSFLPGEKQSFEETIKAHRIEITEFMKEGSDSPLPDTLKSGFEGLNYFTPDPSFKIQATLDKITDNSKLSIPTNDGEIRVFTRYAYANFELSGKGYQLTLLLPNEGDQLFLPFGDLTNGNSTYGGGRYLDIDKTTRNKITIDFNLAYNPYCAYGTDYSCPLPPTENTLSASINAGEMNFD